MLETAQYGRYQYELKNWFYFPLLTHLVLEALCWWILKYEDR